MPLEDFRAVFLPYCLKKQNDGTYAVLNREYKPVGFNTNGFINYADYPVCAKIKGLTAAKAAKLSYNGSSNLASIYLYHDGMNPVRSKENIKKYLAKIALLAKLEIT